MLKRFWNLLQVCLLIAGFLGGQVAAQTSTSPNYQTNEYFFGTGSELDAAGNQYRSQMSAGSLTIGSMASTNYDVEAGFLTPSDPFLEMVVTDQAVELGELPDTNYVYGSAQGGGCSCSFNVRSYLSSEYVVLTMSNPPTNESGDVLAAKATLGVPSTDPTVEEFGINLVDNATPNIGANAVNVPDNSFADGKIATGYNTADQFKYGVGDIVAQSPATPGNQAVGQTNYTLSYIAKRQSFSPAGLYIMQHVLVVVATY
jgi:hypothetical protein